MSILMVGIVFIIFILWVLTAKNSEERGRRLRSPFAWIIYVVVGIPLFIGVVSMLSFDVTAPEGETPVPLVATATATQSPEESAYLKGIVDASTLWETLGVLADQVVAFNEDPSVIDSIVWRKRMVDAISDVRAANQIAQSLTPPPAYKQIDKEVKLAAAEYGAAMDYLSTWVDERSDFPRSEILTHFDAGSAAFDRGVALWNAKLGTPQATAVPPPPPPAPAPLPTDSP